MLHEQKKTTLVLFFEFEALATLAKEIYIY